MIKKYKPTSPGRRHRVVILDPQISKKTHKTKILSRGKSKTGGRNNTGKITIRHRGGGSKRIVRFIDRSYKKSKFSTSKILEINYAPKLSANIALCVTNKESLYYRLATKNVNVGTIFTGPYYKKEIPQEGDVRFLKDIPQGRQIHSIEKIPGAGSIFARSAGTFATLLSHTSKDNSIVLLPSKKTITLANNCLATLGKVGNDKHYLSKAGKAGAIRWKGRRPIVRGEAMNAVDHPHGGNSHSSGGRGKPIKNVWGKLAKFTSSF